MRYPLSSAVRDSRTRPLVRGPRRPRTLTLTRYSALAALAAVTLGCGDSVVRPAERSTMESAKRLASLAEPCGVVFSAITYEENEEMATKYQWPPQADTLEICQTWTGSDYRWAVRTVGTSERSSGTYDMARDAAYENGTLYTAEQGSIVHTQPGQSSMFDIVNASSSQIQASYDDPYYGVVAEEPCQIRACGATLRAADASGAVLAGSEFYRHGVTRRGVRALVESMDEAGASPEGFRRFVSNGPEGVRTLLVHPQSGLLMGEEMRTEVVEVVARHEWVPAIFGFARAGTVVETRARGPDQRLRRRTVLTISNVKLAGR